MPRRSEFSVLSWTRRLLRRARGLLRFLNRRRLVGGSEVGKHLPVAAVPETQHTVITSGGKDQTIRRGGAAVKEGIEAVEIPDRLGVGVAQHPNGTLSG